MLVSRRRFTALTATGLAGIRSLASASRPRPKLIVLLIAEQFRSDYLDLLGNFLGNGGFRRLTDEGAYFPQCQMASTTFTSGGLATLSTGAYPQLHGIVADSWYDRAARKPVTASVKAVEATGFAEQLLATDPAANRIFAIALDSRDASMLAGPSPTDLLYMDAGGRFTAKGKLKDSPWLSVWNQSNSSDKAKNAPWVALGAKRGAPPMRILTFDESRPEEFQHLYRASPFGQAAQFSLLEELLVQERLGQGPGVDFLAVALGSTAALGYEVGGDSPLMRELILHLDRQIETLLTALDKHLVSKNFALIFSSAHGAARETDVRRAVSGETVALTIDRALSDRYDLSGRKNNYVERYVYPFLYLRQDRLQKSYIDPREARLFASQVALRVPGVAGYHTADGDCSHSGDWLRRFRNSFHAVRSGDVMLAYGPGYVEDYAGGRGISYGSLYNYDAQVPLILYGMPFTSDVFETAVEPVDLAPTLARVAGTAWPSSATGRVLSEALAPEG